jgi:alkylation response protein AidB-like acyl-CoA dehydrogenase
MTTETALPEPASAAVTDRELSERFRPVFETVARGAVEREHDRVLPFDQVALLRDSGFTAVTVPVEHGGSGATLGQLFRLLIELAEADSNIPQLLRAHFALLEQAQTTLPAEAASLILRKAGSGTVYGNASHERNAVAVGRYGTVGTRNDDDTWVVNGRKAYSTGSLFADEVFVPAETADGVRVFIVPARADGVNLVDDWDGFGQRLTGSGSTVLTDVSLEADAALELGGGPTHLTAFVQLVLLSVLAGISRAVVRDAAGFVRGRTRVYSHGAAPTAASDPLVLQVVGRLSASAFAVESTVLGAVDRLERAHDAIVAGLDDADALIEEAELAAVSAQLTVGDAVLHSTTQLFDVGGASATSVSRGLDRHWRNARTVASHNPAIYQARILGDHAVNDAPPQYFWATGEQTSTGAEAGA